MRIDTRTLVAAAAIVVGFVAFQLATNPAHADVGRADCSTPRHAVVTWLENASLHPSVAATCFDFDGAGIRAPQDRARMVQQLLAVFDQQGYLVYPESLPNSTEVEGGDRVVVVRRFEDVYVEPTAGAWKFPASVVSRIPEFYGDTFSVDVERYVRMLPTWCRQDVLFGVVWWQFLGLFLAIFVALLVRLLVTNVVARGGERILKRLGQHAMRETVVRAASPIGTLALGGVLLYLFPLLRFGVHVNQVGTIALRVLMACAAVLLVYRLVDVGADVFSRRAEDTDTKLDDQLVPLVRKALKVFVLALGVLFVLQNMDVDVGSLIAGASLGGLAFTLAAKDTVANLFGSISIFADRPFQVGDWVVINGHEGVVEEVGMRSTRIRTFYSSLVTIPNSAVANAAVDNYGMREYRRCMVTLGIGYDATPEQISAFVEGIRAILRANSKVRQDAYEVAFRNFGDSGLEVLVYFFFETDTWTDELAQRQNIFLEIMRLAQDIGVTFAFPTQTLHLDTVAKQGPRKVAPAPSNDDLTAIVESYGPGGSRARPDGVQLTHGYLAAPQARGNDADG